MQARSPGKGGKSEAAERRDVGRIRALRHRRSFLEGLQDRRSHWDQVTLEDNCRGNVRRRSERKVSTQGGVSDGINRCCKSGRARRAVGVENERRRMPLGFWERLFLQSPAFIVTSMCQADIRGDRRLSFTLFLSKADLSRTGPCSLQLACHFGEDGFVIDFLLDTSLIPFPNAGILRLDTSCKSSNTRNQEDASARL